MSHTFDTVDEKIAETEFFLRKMVDVSYLDQAAFNFFLSAYLSASRTTTLSLQHFKDIPGFQEWYEHHRKHLKANGLAKFFLNARNDHVHGGPYPISRVRLQNGKAHHYFSSSANVRYPPSKDVVSACRNYFVILLEIVYDCYLKLGIYIDPQQYYTKENFAAQGRTIDDAEVEIWGWICTSLIEDGFNEDDRWHELRGHVDECKINHLFYSYLGKVTPQPSEPEHYQDFEYTPEEKGWVHIPAGFDSIDSYFKSLDKKRNADDQSDNA